MKVMLWTLVNSKGAIHTYRVMNSRRRMPCLFVSKAQAMEAERGRWLAGKSRARYSPAAIRVEITKVEG